MQLDHYEWFLFLVILVFSFRFANNVRGNFRAANIWNLQVSNNRKQEVKDKLRINEMQS